LKEKLEAYKKNEEVIILNCRKWKTIALEREEELKELKGERSTSSSPRLRKNLSNKTTCDYYYVFN
jgi:hypothetical protein